MNVLSGVIIKGKEGSMGYTFCLECGVVSDGNVCNECGGNNVVDAVDYSPIGMRNCSECGATYKYTVGYCKRCNTSFNS